MQQWLSLGQVTEISSSSPAVGFVILHFWRVGSFLKWSAAYTGCGWNPNHLRFLITWPTPDLTLSINLSFPGAYIGILATLREYSQAN